MGEKGNNYNYLECPKTIIIIQGKKREIKAKKKTPQPPETKRNKS